MNKVAVIMGSMSDLSKVEPIVKILKDYEVEVNFNCLSAHRASSDLSKLINELNNDGTSCIIACAGMSAALPGVIASQTILPVIGVPLTSKNLEGMDALLSIVQMPSGIPVATVAIDGGKNAAYLALQILALQNQNIKQKLLNERQKMHEDAIKNNEELKSRY